MMPDHFSTLRRVIFYSMVLIPLIPFMLAMGIGYYCFKTSLENSTIASMKRIVQDHRQMIEAFLKERKHDLNFILNSYRYEDLNQSEKLETVFDHLQKESYTFVDLGVFNQAGVHVAYHGPYGLRGKVYKDENWFKEVLKHGYYISDIFLHKNRWFLCKSFK